MRKRQQFKIMVKYFADVYYVEGNPIPQLDVTPKDVFPMSENHVFRNPEFVKVFGTIDQTDQYIEECYGRFLVLRNDRHQVDVHADNRPLDILQFGVQLNFVPDEKGNSLEHIFGVKSVIYKRALRSASQFRTAKVLMTEADLVEKVRDHASYGWLRKIEGKFFKTVAKVEPYIGLALSSSLSAGTGYTDVNINDYESKMDISGALAVMEDPETGQNVIVRYDEFKGAKEEDFTPTDGQLMTSPYAMAKVSRRVGIISYTEWKLIRTAFKQGMKFKEQLTDETLGKIWAKIPRGIQIRYGLKKGFAVVIDHDYVDKKGRQFDLVFPSGACKGEVKRFERRYENGQLQVIDHGMGVGDNDVHLCITNVSSLKEKKWGMLNYQFIQALDLDFTNDLQVLASKAIQHILQALKSPEHAMAFIGMIDNGDEEEYEERNLTQKIREILQANPRIFHTKWVQNQIKKLMTKAIDDMKRGRIPVEDAHFAFIVTDPYVLLKDGKPLLKKGEYYFNGETGKRAIFRSPLIHKSEAVLINLVNRPELEEAYGHLKNILILNTFDDTLPRMGGADTDGDKVFITSEPIIVNALEQGLPLIYGDATNQPEMEPFKWENGGWEHIFEYDRRTLSPSQIGIITNYCTSITDKARDIRTKPEMTETYWQLVTIGRVLQGRIIDDAKRGTTTRIDDRLRVQWYPQWLETGMHRYESYSPMGRLYRWITTKVMPAFQEKYGETKDYRVNILTNYKNYNPAELQRILPIVAKLEESYRQDVAEFFEKNGEAPKREDFETVEDFKEEMERRSREFEAIIDRHRRLLATIDAATTTIGMAAIHVAENMQRSGANKVASYPYVVATDYVVALLSELPDNFKLVRVYDVDPMTWASSAVVESGELRNAQGQIMGYVKNKELNGTFETFTFNDSYFIKVPIQVATKEIEHIENKMVQFEMKAFKRFTGMTAEQIIPVLNQQTISLQKIVNDKGQWLGVMFQGRQIGAVGKETLLDANFAQGKTLKVISLQSIRGIVKVTAEVLETGEAVVGEITHAATAPVVEASTQMNLFEFDTTIGM